jgi:hypothetical protein
MVNVARPFHHSNNYFNTFGTRPQQRVLIAGWLVSRDARVSFGFHAVTNRIGPNEFRS